MKRCYYVEYGKIVDTHKLYATDIFINTYEKQRKYYNKKRAEDFAKKVGGILTQGIEL